MKVLVGMDFSKGAEKALEYAINWAKKFDAEIILVHTYLPTVIDPGIPVGMIDTVQLSSNKESEERLEKMVKRVTKDGVPTKYISILGDIKYGINEVNEKENADLLIIGKTANPNFLDRIVGTTSQHLINDISLPLIVVPESFKVSSIRTIAYASELEYDETEILKSTKEIASHINAELKLFSVTVFNEIESMTDQETISEILDHADIDISNFTKIKAKSLRNGISNFIEKSNANLLVLVSHKRGVLDGFLAPSKSKQLIPKIDIPILIYHFN